MSLVWLLASAAVFGIGCQKDGGTGSPSASGGNVGNVGSGGATSGAGGRSATGGSGPSGSGGSSSTGGSTPPSSTGGSGGTAVGTGGTPGTTGSGGSATDAKIDTPAPAETGVPGTGFRIYWIDVEGGAATLLVSPTGESLLADAGWSQRDATRIASVLQLATGAKTLTYFLATHYHVDHVAGAPALAAAVKITNFIDHGASVEGGGDFNAYQMAVTASMAQAKRMMAVPGAKIMLGGVELTILTAGGNVAMGQPTAIANPACGNSMPPRDVADEDPQSVGFVARFGSFEFVDLGDLTGGVEHRLVCPMNQVGKVDLLQSSQHGEDESNTPVLVAGFDPQVVVFNNGAGKGGDGASFERYRTAPNIKDVWAVHKNSGTGMQTTDNALIANPGGTDMAHWIRATVQADGSFTVTNGGTMMSRNYMSR